MELMKAFVRDDAETDSVSLAEVRLPEVGDQEVLVQVQAFGVGLHDRYFIPPDAQLPYVIGIEGSGVVVETGVDAGKFSPGDRVLFSNAMNPKGGTWAKFVAVDEHSLISLPAELDFETAAGFPVAGRTAVESLHTLSLKSQQTLFVAGASGAIGTLVVQMASGSGIRVAGSASSGNHDYLKSLGAEIAVDYNEPEWPQKVAEWADGGVDGVLAIQPGTGLQSESIVREGGHLVTVSGDAFTPERNIRVEQFVHREDAEQDISDLLEAVSSGHIRLIIERTFPFEEALTALEKTETRHARGKVVVRAPTAVRP